MLLAAGADVGAPGCPKTEDSVGDADGDPGCTALERAAQFGRLDIVQLLLDHYEPNEGESLSAICDGAVKHAQRWHHWAVVELLETYQRTPGSP